MPQAASTAVKGTAGQPPVTSDGAAIFGALLQDLFPEAIPEGNSQPDAEDEKPGAAVLPIPVAVPAPVLLVPAGSVQLSGTKCAPDVPVVDAEAAQGGNEATSKLAVTAAGAAVTETAEEIAADTAIVPAQGGSEPGKRAGALAFAARLSETGAPDQQAPDVAASLPAGQTELGTCKTEILEIPAPGAPNVQGTHAKPGEMPARSLKPPAEAKPAGEDPRAVEGDKPDQPRRAAGKQEQTPARPGSTAQERPESREPQADTPPAAVRTATLHTAPAGQAPQPPSGNAGRADRAEPMPSAARMEAPAPPVDRRPAEPVRDIELSVGGHGPERVDVRVAERAGEVRVVVHSSEERLTASLREGLGELTGRLSDRGYRTETWYPGARVAEPAGEIRTTREESAGWNRQQQQPQDHQPDQHPRRQRDHNAPRWVVELENNTPERTLWLSTSLP